ncbi:Intermediate filament protein [Lobulomyces angularis]|nr:Intermediate filament protein [Lobulomyces angularis]
MVFLLLFKLTYQLLTFLGFLFFYGILKQVLPKSKRKTLSKTIDVNKLIGQNVVLKSLPFKQQKYWDRRVKERTPLKLKNVSPKKFQLVIDEMLKFISRDFLNSWYPSVSQEPIFIYTVENFIRNIVKVTIERLERIDTKKFVLEKIGSIILKHMTEYRKAERSLRGTNLQRTLSDSVEMDLEFSKSYLNGQLHQAITSSPTHTLQSELVYLRKISEKYLINLGPPRELKSKLVLTLLREILACKVFQPVIDMLSDPDFWNQTILLLTKNITISEGSISENQANIVSPGNNIENFVDYTFTTSETTIDDIMRRIKGCNDLFDGLQLQFSIEVEITRKRKEILNFNNDDIVNEVKVSDLKHLISQLETARQKINKRLRLLGGSGKNTTLSVEVFNEKEPLEVILKDHVFVSYFTDFLESENHSHLLQLWLNIEILKFGGDSSPNAENDFLNSGGVSIQCTMQEFFVFINNVLNNSSSDGQFSISQVLRLKLDAIYLEVQQQVNENSQITKTKEASFTFLSPEYSSLILELQREIVGLMESDYQKFRLSATFLKFSQERQFRKVWENNELPNLTSGGEQFFGDCEKSGNEAELDDSIIKKTKGKFMDVIKKRKSVQKLAVPKPAKTSVESNLPLIAKEDVIIAVEEVKSNEVTSLPTKEVFSEEKHFSIFKKKKHKMSGESKSTSNIILSDRDSASESVSGSEYLEAKDKKNSTSSFKKKSGLFNVSNSKEKNSPTKSEKEFIKLSGIPTNSTLDSKNVSQNLKKTECREQELKINTNNVVNSTDDENSSPTKNSPKGRLNSALGLEEKTPSTDGYNSSPNNLKQPPLYLTSNLSNLVIGGEIEDLLPACIPIPQKILQKNEEILNIKKEMLENDNQLKSLTSPSGNPTISSVANVSDTKFRQLQLMAVGLKIELDLKLKMKRELEIFVLENLISSSITISIPEYEISHDEKKEFAVYSIEVQQQTEDNVQFGWFIFRRYSEFFDLHQQLKNRFGFLMQQFELPSKNYLHNLKQKKYFLENRKISLEKYLKKLVKVPEILNSTEFKSFISSQEILRALEILRKDLTGVDVEKKKGLWKNIVENFDESVDGFLTKFRNVSPTYTPLIPNQLSSRDFWNKKNFGGILDISTESNAFSSTSTPTTQQDLLEIGDVSSTDIIVDLFQEIFELKEKNNWLRRNAVVLLIQQLFGGTVDRKINEQLKWLFGEENMLYLLENVKESLWPQGKFKEDVIVRSAKEKMECRAKAQNSFVTNLIETVGGVVGKQNAKKGALRLFCVFQNRRLNQHLLYTIADEFFNTFLYEDKK